MNQRLEGINLDIVVATKKPAISTITPEFFNGAGISDSEIELVSDHIYTKNYARMELAHNISISGELNRVTFSEAMVGKSLELLKVPGMAKRYTQTLSNLEYEAIGLNFRGFLSFPSDPDGARKYILSNFFPNASWQTICDTVRAGISLVFEKPRSPLYMNIAEATVRKEDETTMPIVVFSGSFSYVLDGESAAEKLAYMHECIGNWQSDFAEFIEIIDNHFLAKPVIESYPQLPSLETEVPNIFAMSAAV
jgi:hypothetical protein